MGDVADRLDELTVTVHSPDGNFSVTVQGPRKIQFEIGRRAYDAYVRYDIGEFERQLSHLATLTWTKYQRGVRAIAGDATPDTYHDLGGEEVVNYNNQRAQIEAEATSADGAVSIRTRGMVQWGVSLDRDLVRRIPPQQILSGLNTALQLTVSRYLVQQYALRDKLFGDGLPDRFQPIRSMQ